MQALKDQLTRQQADYIIDQREADDSCRLRFIGDFEGRPVIWHAHIRSLDHYARNHPSGSGRQRLRQYIDIQPGDDGYELEVGLNLQKIDEAALLRTIIMIRQYKRLHAGRHEYGEWIEFPQHQAGRNSLD